ncbi:MAG: FAD binding domain-containing protein [Chloroflexota bacterium]|nr:FAD binding domain-containing protein [Chloroflexota bacterium]
MTNPKTYHRPKTLIDAGRLAAQPGSVAVNGGALTLSTLDLPFETVIDLQDIASLREISAQENGVIVGGGVMLGALAEQPGLDPVIRRALTRAVPLNVRNGLSVAESIHQLDTPMLREWLALLTTLDVGTHWLTSQAVPVTYNMAELLAHLEAGGTLHSVLQRLDLVGYVQHRQALGAACVARTPSDIPIVNAAVYLRLDAEQTIDIAFAAVCGASPAPVTLVSLAIDPSLPFTAIDPQAAVAIVADQLDPVGDWHGSAEYRREMAVVCVRRALEECLERLN